MVALMRTHITGRLAGHDGTPMPARVNAADCDVPVDAEGNFALELPDGEHVLKARGSGRYLGSARVRVRQGAAILQLGNGSWRELLGETIAHELVREAYADVAKGEHLKRGCAVSEGKRDLAHKT
jgi:hypothetical protein